MLHGLAGFIFGKSPSMGSPAGRDDRHDDGIKNAIESATVPLKREIVDIATDEDGEWLLVDVHGDENLSLDTLAEVSALPDFDTVLASSGKSSPVEERGWNLTPPPCFTASFQERAAAGFASIADATNEESKRKASIVEGNPGEGALNAVLETSNFENLLIEHPSMSVYGRLAPSRQRGAQLTQGYQSQANAAPTPTPPMAEENDDNTAPAPPARRPATAAELLLGTDLSTFASRRVNLDKQQRLERAYKAKELAPNRTRRSNAVAITPSQGKGSPRKRRMQTHPAGRCNDRKRQ